MASFQFQYDVYDSEGALDFADRELLMAAMEATGLSYAPYSGFRVGVAALLQGGTIVRGANQENAAYPVGICAERVLLGTVATQFPGKPIVTLAISFRSEGGPGDKPITPCGICRQSLLEFQQRTGRPIRLVMGAERGPVWVIPDAGMLLPLGFGSAHLG